jgi:hypothetical protein
MTRKKETISSILFGESVSQLVSKAESQGFNPDREKTILLVLDGERIRVISSLNKFEIVGMLHSAIDVVLTED